jgi:hypothetical protein
MSEDILCCGECVEVQEDEEPPLGLVARCRPQQEPDVGELPALSKDTARGEGAGFGCWVGWLTLAY